MKRSVSESKKRIVAASYNWKCAACEETLESTFHVDHIVALHNGGTNDLENLQPLCVKDHAIKTQQEAIERNNRKERMREARNFKRAPLECTHCGIIISPYFPSHICEV